MCERSCDMFARIILNVGCLAILTLLLVGVIQKHEQASATAVHSNVRFGRLVGGTKLWWRVRCVNRATMLWGHREPRCLELLVTSLPAPAFDFRQSQSTLCRSMRKQTRLSRFLGTLGGRSLSQHMEGTRSLPVQSKAESEDAKNEIVQILRAHHLDPQREGSLDGWIVRRQAASRADVSLHVTEQTREVTSSKDTGNAKVLTCAVALLPNMCSRMWFVA